MRIKKLYLRNIRSYVEQEVEFPSGALLLSGNVGSGKTTILLAIEYALFGLQAGQRGAALMRNDADESEVSLHCEIEGYDVVIERKLKRDSRSIVSDYSAITLDGEKIECSPTELKTKILELLGYPSEFVKKNNLLFKYTIYTPQEQMKAIITEDPASRFSILRHVFGIDKYKQINSNLEIVLAHLKDNSRYLQADISTIENDKESLKNQELSLKRLEEQINEVQQDIVLKLSEQDKIEKSLEEMELKIKEKEKLEQEVEKTSILLTTKYERISLIEREENELKKQILSSSETFQADLYLKVIDKIAAVKEELSSLEKEHISLEGAKRALEHTQSEELEKKKRVFSIEVCPTCLQDVPEAHKHNILNETESKIVLLQKQGTTIAEKISQVQTSTNLKKSELSSLESKKSELELIRSRQTFMDHAKNKLDLLSKTGKTIWEDISLLEKHMNELKSLILQHAPFEQKYKLKLSELKQVQNEERGKEISLAELKKEHELTLQNISSLHQNISRKEQTRRKLSSLLELHDWLSNNFKALVDFIERQVMMKLRLEFSRLFSTWFGIIAGETFEVQLDEHFTPLVLQKGIEMEYSFLSGGERTALALAYRLALNQTINSIMSSIKTKDVLILDEPTEGFSSAQIEKMRDILEELKMQQIIIVSHEPIIEGFVDHILRVHKEAEISTVQ